MQLSDETRAILRTVFEWAGNDYAQALRNMTGYVYPSFGIDEIQEHYPTLRRLLFEDPTVRARFYFDQWPEAAALGGEGKFECAIENLLEWTGMYQLTGGRNKVEDFLTLFENALDVGPQKVTYIPVFRLTTDAQIYNAPPIRLNDWITFGRFSAVEQRILRNAAITISQTYDLPGLHENLPSIGFKVVHGVDVVPGQIVDPVRTALNSFKAIMRGFFRFNVGIEYQFQGTRFPWHPCEGCMPRYPAKRAETRTFCTLRPNDYAILQRYWPMLYPDVLSRYSITATRLALLEKRELWYDHVVDLGVALESLIEAEELINANISKIVPFALEDAGAARDAMTTRLRDFYALRSAVVHGVELEHARAQVRDRFARMTFQQFRQEMGEIENIIQRFLKLQFLNDHLRSRAGQNAIFQDRPTPAILREPTL